jgi:ubiquinone/menaquinone biosynthesis C-methylase UbiE
MRDSYAGLASVYDHMARDPGIRRCYEEWRRALLEAAAERGVRGRVLVDLACGTGNSTVPWARRRGWTVVGVDRSAAMLREARRKSRRVRWIRQDITRLDIGGLSGRADFVTCHFDALNHVLDERDLQRVFTRVRRLLRPGGLFQFDLNTVHWLRWLKGREKLFRAGPHVFMASNEFDERTGIATFHQYWFVRTGRLYQMRHIVVRERAFADADIRGMLRKAGLRLLKATTQIVIDGKPGRRLFLSARSASIR